MKRKTQVLWSLLLTGVMAVGSLTGCGSKTASGNTASAETETKSGTEQKGSTGTAEGGNSTFIADRTIKVQVYVDDIGYSLPKDISKSPVFEELKKRTGITLDINYTPGDSDSETMSAQLASGTIPDVIVSYLNDSTRKEFPILLKAAKEGMFADVSKYMKDSKVYSKYYKDGFLPEDTHDNIEFRKDFNNAVYIMQLAVPDVDRSTETDPNSEYVGGMYIQTKIAKKLGIDPKSIRTEDQFYDLLCKIKAGGFKDDNGNAVYPLGPKYWGGSVDALDYICPGFNWGVSDGYNIDKSGNVKHEAETDYCYDKINYVRKLLADGLMNPEFFTMDETRAEEATKTHNSAIVADIHNYVDVVNDTDDWEPLGPLNDYTGSNAKVVSGKTGYGEWAINADAKNPEEIFKFFDYLSTKEGQLLMEYGVDGLSYNMVNGYPVLTKDVQKHLDDGDNDWLVNNVGAGFGGSGCVFCDYMLTDTDPMTYFGEARPGAKSSTKFAGAIKVAKNFPREKKLVPGLNATAYLSDESMTDVKTQMDLLDYKETLVQAMFASNDAEVKKIIESFRAQLKAAGVEKFEQYLKQRYTSDPKSIKFY